MQSKHLLPIVLATALFQGANSCAVDAHISPSVDAQQSNQHHGSQSYTMVFCKSGIAKGDIACDKSATLIGAADAVVATNAESLKLMKGSCMVVAASHDVKVDLPKLNTVTVGAHGKAVFSRVDDKVCIQVKAGSSKVSTSASNVNLPSGSQVVVDGDAVENGVLDSVQNAVFLEKDSKNGSEPVRLLADDGTKFAVKEGALWLKHASAFVEMPGGVNLVTPGGTISSARPYLISCRLVDDAMCLENCSPVTIVQMDIKGDRFKLAPFKSCSIKHGDETRVQIPDDGVLRRDVVAESDGKLTKMISEYDPLSLLEAHTELKKSVAKPITFHQQRSCETLLKSIAVFEELCGDVDSFEEKPSLQVRSVKGRIASAKNNNSELSLATGKASIQ